MLGLKWITISWTGFLICINDCSCAVMYLRQHDKIVFDNSSFDSFCSCMENKYTQTCRITLSYKTDFEFAPTDIAWFTYNYPKVAKLKRYKCDLISISLSYFYECTRDRDANHADKLCPKYGFIINWGDDSEQLVDDSLRNCSVTANMFAYSRQDQQRTVPAVLAGNSANQIETKNTINSDPQDTFRGAFIFTTVSLCLAIFFIVVLLIAKEKSTSVVQLFCPEQLLKFIPSSKRRHRVNVYNSTDMNQKDVHYYDEAMENNRECSEYHEINESKLGLHTNYLQVI